MTKGTVGKGWSLVWRHSRILWWVFAVNLVLGLLATIATRLEFGNVLNKSLHSGGIANRFDFGVFIELLSKPEVSLGPLVGGTLAFPWLFFLFMLFAIGGILTAYREDRRLTTAEFFEASGGYFWRMVRLFLLSIIPLALCGIVFSIFFGIASQLENERSAFHLQIVGGVIGTICVLLVRLWFDVAQVRAVAQNEHGMFRNLLRAFSISFRALGTLLWMYLRISIVAWLILWCGLWLWTHLPGNQVAFTWILLELVMLTQIFARLWQRAASVTWYGLYAEEHSAAVVEFTTPHPAELTVPPAAPGPVPPAEPI